MLGWVFPLFMSRVLWGWGWGGGGGGGGGGGRLASGVGGGAVCSPSSGGASDNAADVWDGLRARRGFTGGTPEGLTGEDARATTGARPAAASDASSPRSASALPIDDAESPRSGAEAGRMRGLS